jgi:hypothetical protein
MPCARRRKTKSESGFPGHGAAYDSLEVCAWVTLETTQKFLENSKPSRGNFCLRFYEYKPSEQMKKMQLGHLKITFKSNPLAKGGGGFPPALTNEAKIV